MHASIRVGAVNYLNTKPLICDLERIAPEAELILDVPSRLADRLADRELDVALIPVVEYFRAGTYSVVPDVSRIHSVACRTVRSGTAGATVAPLAIAQGNVNA